MQRSRVQLSPCCKSLSPRSEAVCSSLESQGRGCERERVRDREIYIERKYTKKGHKNVCNITQTRVAGSGSGWIRKIFPVPTWLLNNEYVLYYVMYSDKKKYEQNYNKILFDQFVKFCRE